MFIVEYYNFLSNIATDRAKKFIKCNYYEILLFNFIWLHENRLNVIKLLRFCYSTVMNATLFCPCYPWLMCYPTVFATLMYHLDFLYDPLPCYYFSGRKTNLTYASAISLHSHSCNQPNSLYILNSDFLPEKCNQDKRCSMYTAY